MQRFIQCGCQTGNKGNTYTNGIIIVQLMLIQRGMKKLVSIRLPLFSALLITALLLGVIIIPGCEKADNNIITIDADPVAAVIEKKQCATFSLNGDTLQLCYDSLLQDSRCPVDVVCVWSGVATVGIKAIHQQQTHYLELSTLDFNKWRMDTTIGNFSIKLDDVKPYPVSGKPSGNEEQKVYITVKAK